MEAALSHVVRNKVEAAYARSDLFPNRVGKQLEEKQLRRMFRKHGIAAVPHGFRSRFRDWAAEEIIRYRRWSYIVVTLCL